ncbi:hypothetical protein C8J57DRAFT_1220170 [Mycena rebaudengoi]|nr:hypothetical protein C8J57DRAFT_1220170 [Mycena rebaudengoi]
MPRNRTKRQLNQSKELKFLAMKGVKTPRVQGWLLNARNPHSIFREKIRQRVLERMARKARVEELMRARNAPRKPGGDLLRLIRHASHTFREIGGRQGAGCGRAGVAGGGARVAGVEGCTSSDASGGGGEQTPIWLLLTEAEALVA